LHGDLGCHIETGTGLKNKGQRRQKGLSGYALGSFSTTRSPRSLETQGTQRKPAVLIEFLCASCGESL
jgi:hypothetical protein